MPVTMCLDEWHPSQVVVIASSTKSHVLPAGYSLSVLILQSALQKADRYLSAYQQTVPELQPQRVVGGHLSVIEVHSVYSIIVVSTFCVVENGSRQ